MDTQRLSVAPQGEGMAGESDSAQGVAPATDDRTLRAQLAVRINELIRERRLTQTTVAGIFGIPQPHISELRNYKLGRFSSERLMRFITLLDRDVEIVIRPKSENHAEGMVSVQVAA